MRVHDTCRTAGNIISERNKTKDTQTQAIDKIFSPSLCPLIMLIVGHGIAHRTTFSIRTNLFDESHKTRT